STTSGYMGGTKKNPSYEEVSSGTTGHAEVVQVVYDPKKVSYEKLLEVFWKNVDPTVRDRQFCDIGSQYRTAIFYHSDEQKRLAEASKGMLAKTKPFRDDIVTPIVQAVKREGGGWIAERATRMGDLVGGERMQALAMQANRYAPELRTHDRFGNRIDAVEYHPAYHELMTLAFGAGLHSLAWTDKRE